jgi:hypothetical protein
MNEVEKLQEEITQRRASVLALAHLWELAIGNDIPADGQFAVWLDLHRFEHVVHAIKETGHKQSRRTEKMSADHLVRFVSSVANKRKIEVRKWEARVAHSKAAA